MAHVGQEFALGAIGGIRLVARGRKFDFRQFELGDVFQADQHAPRLAIGAQHRRAVDREGTQAAVGGDQTQGVVTLHLATGQRALPRRLGLQRLAAVIQPGDAGCRRPHQLLVAAAKGARQGLVGQHDVAFLVDHQKPLGQGIERRADAAGNRGRGVEMAQHAPEVQMESDEAKYGAGQRQAQPGQLKHAGDARRGQRLETEFNPAPGL